MPIPGCDKSPLLQARFSSIVAACISPAGTYLQAGMESDNRTTRPEDKELQDAAKDWIAIDGLWFQAVEQAYGMDAAVAIDCKVWEQFAAIEADRIIKRLGLPEAGGLDALEAALKARLVHAVNAFTITRPDNGTLIFTITGCRVQSARERKGLADFPCRAVGIVEFSTFAVKIDPRIATECLSCPPVTRDGVRYCRWKFILKG